MIGNEMSLGDWRTGSFGFYRFCSGAAALCFKAFSRRMSDFVNYNKRSITLPPGCKDLIDVLRSEGRDLDWFAKRVGIDLSRAIRRGGMFEGTFLEVEKNVHRAVTSSALMFILKIIPADQRFSFTLLRLYQRPLQVIVELETGTPEGAALGQSLAAHKLRTPDAIEPGPSLSDQPWRLTWPIEPLPGDPLALSKLISELLRDIGGLIAESALVFHHQEIVMPA